MIASVEVERREEHILFVLNRRKPKHELRSHSDV